MSKYEWVPKNREKKRAPRKGRRYWCWNCDAALMGRGQRCPNCGHKDAQKSNKK